MVGGCSVGRKVNELGAERDDKATRPGEYGDEIRARREDEEGRK